MELRHIRSFAAIACEGNISRAAKKLGISQPALSKQLGELEADLGQVLIERGARTVRLTAKGEVFRKRAGEILSLVNCTVREVTCAASKLSGRITIGAAETFGFARIAAALRDLQRKNPAVSFQLVSGNAEDLAGRIQKGTLDLAVLIGPDRLEGCETLPLNVCHELGLVLPKDDPLAKKKGVAPSDLLGRSLLLPRRLRLSSELAGWAGYDVARLNVVGTFNLLYNAAHAVAEGVGAALSFDGLIPEMLASKIVFRPLVPVVYGSAYLTWKENAELPPAAAELVRLVRAQAKVCVELEDFGKGGKEKITKSTERFTKQK